MASSNIGFEECWSVLPDELGLGDVFSGGLVEGQICFEVPTAEIDSLVMYASAGWSGEDIFFSLNEESPQPSGVPSAYGPVTGAISTNDRLSPNPIGESINIGDGWELTVNSANPDATQVLLAENMFNEVPPAGYTYYLVDVTLTNISDDMQGSALGVTLNAVGDSNVAYEDCWSVLPNELDIFVDIFPEGSIQGNICFLVPINDAETGVLLYAEGELFGDSLTWFDTASQ